MATTVSRPPAVSLVIEQTLGHRTHTQNIERVVVNRPEFAMHRIEYREDSRLPWALRASIDAWRAVRSEHADVTFFHTQCVSLLAPLATWNRPYVVSIDATPIQVDSMARWYNHVPGSPPAERVKREWYHSVFVRARAVVAWSEWAADSLRNDYGVTDTPIEVLHPGAPEELFTIERNRASSRPTILFVGGDFERKGGPSLLRAFERLNGAAELVIMSDAPIAPPPGVTIARGVRAGSEEHRRIFAQADLFCLPTLGDCTPLVIGEAMAAGLPILTTRIGSNAESVGDDSGVLIEPGDDEGLSVALADLVSDPERLRVMGERARARASRFMRAQTNAQRIIEVLSTIAARGAL